MEEQQIQEFVHQVALNVAIRSELASDPVGVLQRQDVSPRVSQILARLVPYLVFDRPIASNEKWWHV